MQLILVCKMAPFSLSDVIDREDARRIAASFSTLPTLDGRATAGWAARDAKRNRQLDARDAEVAALQQRLQSALQAHPVFQLYARPQRITLPLLSRYEPGMEYGRHVDDALMGEPPLRSDLAFTLFLAAPEEYDGGELLIEASGGDIAVKLPAGAAVLYPAGSLHRVAMVTRGVRCAAVGWVQSHVRDAARREVLFDLERARRSAHARAPDGEDFALLSQATGNLLRMWSEP
jgi:PKHD-type hydroxylase